MDKPVLPGFTAEAALAAMRQQNYGSAVGAALGRSATLRVHLSLGPWRPPPNCNPDCVCISPIGCPCCIGPGPGYPWLLSRRTWS
jgi:hypothetical protein